MRRTGYDAGQAAKRLKVPAAAFRWARHTGLIPDPDASSHQWSQAAVEALDADAIRAAMSSPPISGGTATDRIADTLKARRTGEKVAVGPGAERLHAGLDQVIAAMEDDPVLRAQIADERAEAALLADQFPNLHLGAINHCMFDAPQAECQNELPADQRGRASLIGACQPDRCRNSVITEPMPRSGSTRKTT
ncbi:hypothetical protein [Streptomyces sp. NPDC002676]